jgi:hypothetical protein
MNKIIVVVFVCFLGVQSFAQRKPKIKGNRNVTVVTENLPAFRAISLDDDIEVMIEKASAESVTIEADDNLIDVLKFNVSNGTLFVSSFYNITSKKKLNITVYYTELDALTISNGLITMKDVITTDQFKVKTSGASRVVLNASADVIDIHMEENSSGDFNVASDSLNLIFKDRIDAKVYATGQSNSLLMYKNSSVKLEGNTELFTVKLYGNSTLKAEEFTSRVIHLYAEDSPDARVYADDEFQLSAKGSSKTSLYGNPKITMLEFLDTAQLHKENK